MQGASQADKDHLLGASPVAFFSYDTHAVLLLVHKAVTDAQTFFFRKQGSSGLPQEKGSSLVLPNSLNFPDRPRSRTLRVCFATLLVDGNWGSNIN